MKKLRIKLRIKLDSEEEEVLLELSRVTPSYGLFIGFKGLRLHSTSYPQTGIDYNLSNGGHRLKVVGVDIV